LDGRFPNHHPDPTVPENVRELIATVAATGAELGIAFDGDADRIGVVDARGRIIWGDELLVLYGRDVLARNPGAVIVSEVKCSQRLYDDIARHGGRGVMWKAGHSLLKAKMKETGALLGGEMSGHIFFKERYFGYDDAVYAGARLLEILGRTGRTLGELLADLPASETTPEIRVDCPDAIKFAVADRVRDRFRAEGRDIIDVDGVRVRFPNGWGLLRASNTQPVLVMRFEAHTREDLAVYQRIVEEAVAAARAELRG
jgi:phosphomannomutase/phosphoglucomutase